jgi:uncharacterized protein YndB with AHSA1/START domain
MTDVTERTVTYDTFVIERDYPAAPARVFQAFADPEAKRNWFGGPTTQKIEFDFRVGGREIQAGGEPNDPAADYRFVATYHDIVDNERIIYSYEMYVGGQRLSVSQTTVLFEERDGGTHLSFTEYGAYLDGLEPIGLRERGTIELLDAVGAYLAG